MLKMAYFHAYWALFCIKVALVTDPCMGSGHILVYAFDVLMDIYRSRGYTDRDAVQSIVTNNLFGLDIDDRAGQLAYFAIMMKACEYDRRFLRRNVQPHVCAIQESPRVDMKVLDAFGPDAPLAKKLYAAFIDAKEYGSILHVDLTGAELQRLSHRMMALHIPITADDLSHLGESMHSVDIMAPLVKQARIMTRKYDVVCTNPPYMGSSGMNEKLLKFTKDNYPDSKTDMFAVFIEKCNDFMRDVGYQAMVTQHAWMFLSSYEKLRNKIQNNELICMAHLGPRAFEEIGGEVVQTTTFILQNIHIDGYVGCYARLIEPTTQQGKQEMFLAEQNRYITQQENFDKIPGCIFAYWLTNKFVNILEQKGKLNAYGNARQGLATSDNRRFLRLWYEIDWMKIDFDCKSCSEIINRGTKWFPYNKAGNYRKWSSINEYVVNYERDGEEIKETVMMKYPYLNNPGFVVKNTDTYFHHGITWNDVATGAFCCRYVPDGFIYDASGPMFFSENDFIMLGYFNSIVFQAFANVICQGLHYSTGHIPAIPYKAHDNEEIVSSLSKDNIAISKQDWDSFETSWDFQCHPMI